MGKHATDLLGQIIQDAQTDTALEVRTPTVKASAMFRMSNPEATLKEAWKLRRNNQLFLQLLNLDTGSEDTEKVAAPAATYRISFPYPLRRITAWRYKKNGFQLQSKKIQLLEFFVLLAKLKEALEGGRLLSEQLVFTLNQHILTNNPLYIIDCVMMMYQQRKAELALKYADDRAGKRFAHRFDDSRFLLDAPELAELTEEQADRKFAKFKAARMEAASSGGGGENPLDQIDPFLSGPPTSGPERNDDAFMDAFIQEGKEEFERKAAASAEEAEEVEITDEEAEAAATKATKAAEEEAWNELEYEEEAGEAEKEER